MSAAPVEPTRPKPRIESLSDMIFGLALSVGAITLVGNPPQTNGDLYNDLVGFGFSFLILIQVWIGYTRTMSVLPLEDGRTIFLNIVLLFCVSVEPFLFHILNSTKIARTVSIAFAVDLGMLTLILGFFKSLLADESRKLIPVDQLEQFKLESIIQFSTGALYFVSALPPVLERNGTFRRSIALHPLVRCSCDNVGAREARQKYESEGETAVPESS